ncbi:unnamed protein product [Linum trigynum]|uniref:Uncharacterized protein n=1 Tax=Linum trigynum TaxID=586398 RepID=A0AAV2DUK4_9ROSI
MIGQVDQQQGWVRELEQEKPIGAMQEVDWSMVASLLVGGCAKTRGKTEAVVGQIYKTDGKEQHQRRAERQQVYARGRREQHQRQEARGNNGNGTNSGDGDSPIY